MVQRELAEAKALWTWAVLNRRKRPELRLLFAIPNGGARDVRTGAMLKATGVQPGVPDYFLPVARGQFFGLVLELKAGKGRLSAPQEWWRDALTAEGYQYVLARGWQNAANEIETYLQQNRHAVNL